MSEHKLVSPLLDGFQMGAPISDHDGVRCCPAIKENSDSKYIVKILSIPASQAQLDALLLTGAFQDAAGALNYFKELTDGVVQEVKLHQRLSRGGGFVPCEGWQVVPMDNNQLGYDVYLLTPYRRTLERHLSRNPLTHLEAVNLGLDLCAALAACRRIGYLYVDLKPSNIFISHEKNYLIGDLGFVRLDSIQYASLPAKYRSRYSAPELHDIYATISGTADIYALGLILYQVYNDGTLPFDAQPPVEELAPPSNADYEMAEIILKACHPDPAQRWQDPTEMGQALVAYMQRNTVNDVPILPPVVEEPQEELAESEDTPEEDIREETSDTGEETTPAEEPPQAEEATESADEVPAEPVEAEETDETTQAVASEEADPSEASAEPVEEAEDVSEEVPPAETEEAVEAESESAAPTEEPMAEEASEPEETPEGEEIPVEETEPQEAPAQESAESQEPAAEVAADEMDRILAQADELAAHQVPDPVVVPEGKLPPQEPVIPEEPEAPTTSVEPELDEDAADEIPLPVPQLPSKKRGKKIVVTLITFLLLAALGFGGKYYYDNYYLIPVTSITLDGTANQITAHVVVDMDHALLTAVCTDTYGNTATAPVVDGIAVFDGLKSGNQYTVSLTTSSFNQLCGNNSASFTTTRQTNVVSMSAITGPENGSVILSFTVDGTDPQNWTVEYSAPEQELKTLDFTGHMVTVTGLAMDTTYTFHIRPTIPTEVPVVGTNTLDFTVSQVILAQNIAIASFHEGVMDLRWDAPEGMEVAEWTVRCSDGGSFDQTITVNGCEAQFTGTEMGKTYTIEILAQGMTQSVRTELTPMELTISNLNCTPMGSGTLRVTWDYQGDAPAEGWTVSYSINGGKTQTATTQTNAADLRPLIPGAKYEVALSDLTASYQAPAAEAFAAFGLTADQITGSFCQTPNVSNWDYSHVTKYIKEFTPGQSISMVVYINAKVNIPSADVEVMYVIRDADGNALPELCVSQNMKWQNMWKDRYFYLTLPNAPTTAGSYTMELYVDGAIVLKKPFFIK